MLKFVLSIFVGFFTVHASVGLCSTFNEQDVKRNPSPRERVRDGDLTAK